MLFHNTMIALSLTLLQYCSHHTAMRMNDSTKFPSHRWVLFRGGSNRIDSVRNTKEVDVKHVIIAIHANVMVPADSLAGPD